MDLENLFGRTFGTSGKDVNGRELTLSASGPLHLSVTFSIDSTDPPRSPFIKFFKSLNPFFGFLIKLIYKSKIHEKKKEFLQLISQFI